MSDANATNGRATDEPSQRFHDLSRWFLLTGNRFAVAAVMLAGIDGLFVAAGALDLATVTTPNRMLWFLNGTVNGLLTLVPISVGVNQIVLSHEFGSVQDLYQRRTDVNKFRKRVESYTGDGVSSPRSSGFFRQLLTAISETALAFREACERRGDEYPADVRAFAASVAGDADETSDRLSGSEPEMLATLLVVLDYDDSIQFVETRQLNAAPDLDLSSEAKAKLYELEELFTQFDAARQYLKTVVIERQLAQLSRLLVYTGIPAVGIAALGIFAYRDVAGMTVPRPALVVAAGTLIAASLVPLAILSAYILRVATIARRTATFGPFVPELKFRTDEDRDW